jgi:hypothetical protein
MGRQFQAQRRPFGGLLYLPRPLPEAVDEEPPAVQVPVQPDVALACVVLVRQES